MESIDKILAEAEELGLTEVKSGVIASMLAPVLVKLPESVVEQIAMAAIMAKGVMAELSPKQIAMALWVSCPLESVLDEAQLREMDEEHREKAGAMAAEARSQVEALDALFNLPDAEEEVT